MRKGRFGRATGARDSTVLLLPSFFIIGPPRTATSWLQNVLSQYAHLAYPTKETRFFDKNFDRGLAWYGAHFRQGANERAIGEVAPTYFASSDARERIARLIPHAKIVCTFRNPVDRLVSLYRLKRAYGWISWNFDEALAKDPELLETSRYAAHLKRWKEAFGDAQVLATVHDDIQSNPQSYLDQLLDFIGLPRLELLPAHVQRVLASEEMSAPRHYYWTRAGLMFSEWAKKQRLDWMLERAKKLGAMKLFVGGGPAFADPSSSQLENLRRLLLPEIEALELLLNRDFSSWKVPAIVASDRPIAAASPELPSSLAPNIYAPAAPGLPANFTSTSRRSSSET